MPKAIRDVYGEQIALIADRDKSIVMLDADVSSSTKSCVFAAAHPDRFFNMGIAEANMFATAAGLASTGKKAFVNVFAVFAGSIGLIATRTLACYGGLNVKIAASYCGLSDALDGASHHATEDISIMRALPGMTVAVPSDPESTRWATSFAAEHDGPVYIRISREPYPALYPEETQFEPGRGRVVRKGRDAVVFACGVMVHKALEAAEILAAEGIEITVADILFIKPIDSELIVKCARENGAVVSAEEHNIFGGLGSAVSDVLSFKGIAAPHEFVGIQDCFTESGKYDELLDKYQLNANAVAEAVRRALSRKFSKDT